MTGDKKPEIRFSLLDEMQSEVESASLRVTALICGFALEDALSELVQNRTLQFDKLPGRDPMHRHGFRLLLIYALQLELINEDEFGVLNSIVKVRNHFAHWPPATNGDTQALKMEKAPKSRIEALKPSSWSPNPKLAGTDDGRKARLLEASLDLEWDLRHRAWKLQQERT